jgi:hypothetical protein
VLLVTGGALEAGVPALGVQEEFVGVELVDDVFLALVRVGLNHVRAHVFVVRRVLHVVQLHSDSSTVTSIGVIAIENVLHTNQAISCANLTVLGTNVSRVSAHVALGLLTVQKSKLLGIADLD